MKDNGEIVKFLKEKDYEMINNNLGAGSFGKTVLLKDPFIDELFVAKKYEPYYEEDKKQFYDSFLQEIKIMHKLNHRNVIRIYNYYAYESSYTGYILMEYINGENISDYLNNYCPPFEDGPDPDEIFTQLINGFQYIEAQGIVHRDIREGNILIDKTGTVKIIDFGLGKTFKAVETTGDSMVDIINRSGLDCLPQEYFEGVYTSQTDMFYFAELFNRLLRNSDNMWLFSYQKILTKMMEVDPAKRFQSFSDVQDAIGTKDFSTMEISDEDKKIYQAFSGSLFECIASYIGERLFVTDVQAFINKLHDLIQKNCFETYIQDNSDLVRTVLTCRYRYYQYPKYQCKVKDVQDFYKWYVTLSDSSKQLVLNNIHGKLSTIPAEEPEPELPF